MSSAGSVGSIGSWGVDKAGDASRVGGQGSPEPPPSLAEEGGRVVRWAFADI